MSHLFYRQFVTLVRSKVPSGLLVQGTYRVYNLCSERTYDDHWFHDRVFHWPVDDHNVPAVSEMVDFVEEVREQATLLLRSSIWEI